VEINEIKPSEIACPLPGVGEEKTCPSNENFIYNPIRLGFQLLWGALICIDRIFRNAMLH
jgi:hypothetical protein